jgi:hypothetical protein
MVGVVGAAVSQRTSAGISLISQESPMFQEIAKVSAIATLHSVYGYRYEFIESSCRQTPGSSVNSAAKPEAPAPIPPLPGGS